MNEKLTSKQPEMVTITEEHWNDFQQLVVNNANLEKENKELKQLLTAHPAEDECMCQCFTCQGSGKWASGYCLDSENPAHTAEDEIHRCRCGEPMSYSITLLIELDEYHWTCINCGWTELENLHPPEDELEKYPTKWAYEQLVKHHQEHNTAEDECKCRIGIQDTCSDRVNCGDWCVNWLQQEDK